jgi:hypothetical protein
MRVDLIIIIVIIIIIIIVVVSAPLTLCDNGMQIYGKHNFISPNITSASELFSTRQHCSVVRFFACSLFDCSEPKALKLKRAFIRLRKRIMEGNKRKDVSQLCVIL